MRRGGSGGIGVGGGGGEAFILRRSRYLPTGVILHITILLLWGGRGNWRLYYWQLPRRQPQHKEEPLGLRREGKYRKRCQCQGN